MCVFVYECAYAIYSNRNITSLTQDIQTLLPRRVSPNSPESKGSRWQIFTLVYIRTLTGRGRHDCNAEAMIKRNARSRRSRGQRQYMMIKQEFSTTKAQSQITKEVINLMESVGYTIRLCNVQTHWQTPSTFIQTRLLHQSFYMSFKIWTTQFYSPQFLLQFRYSFYWSTIVY